MQSQNAPFRHPGLDMTGTVFACVVLDPQASIYPAEAELAARGARVTRLLASSVFPRAQLDAATCRFLARLYDGLIVPKELEMNLRAVAAAVGVLVLEGGSSV